MHTPSLESLNFWKEVCIVAVQRKRITDGGFIASTFTGGLGEVIGGKGANTNSLEAAWKGSQKGLTREMRRTNVKFTAKQIAKYTARKTAVKYAVKVGAARFAGGVITYTGIRLKYGY